MLLFGGFSYSQVKDITALKSRIPKLQDSIQRASVYAKLGMLYTSRLLDSSYYYASRALELARQAGDKSVEAEALNVLAFYHLEQRKTYLSYKYANESLRIFRQLRNAPKVSEVTMNIGVLLSFEGKHDEALTYFKQAYEMAEQHPTDSITPLIILNLALSQSYDTDYATVAPLFDRAQALAEQQGNNLFLLYIRQGRNIVHFQDGMPLSEVIPEHHDIILQNREDGYEYYTALGYLELGEMYLDLNIDSAQHYFDLGISLAQESGYPVFYHDALGMAYDALKSLDSPPAKITEYAERIVEFERQQQDGGPDFLQLASMEQEIAAKQAHDEAQHTWMLLLAAICTLAVVFALLLLRLYRHKRRLVRHLAESNAKLSEKNLQFENNSEFLQKLVSIMSHDLRQPLSSILMLGHGELVEQMDAQQRLYVFDQLHQAARSSLQAMDGLVHWMKLDALGMAYSPSEVNLKESIREAVAFNQALAEKKRISIMNFISDTTQVLAQPEMLLFINRNLISNALRHTPETGRIVLISQLAANSQYIKVSISDNGDGLPEALIPQLFTKDRTMQERSHHGSGLALIICHEMITKMSGTIGAMNNPEQGATFYYELPLVHSA